MVPTTTNLNVGVDARARLYNMIPLWDSLSLPGYGDDGQKVAVVNQSSGILTMKGCDLSEPGTSSRIN